VLIVISTAAGMILWVVLWSFGIKSLDAAMLFLMVVLGAATVRGVAIMLPGNRDPDQARSDSAPFT